MVLWIYPNRRKIASPAGVFILLLLTLVPVLAQEKISPEEYSVYAFVLKDIYRENRKTDPNGSLLVIVSETEADLDLGPSWERRHRNLSRDFKRRNVRSGTIERKFPRGAYSTSYYLASKAQIDELLKAGEGDYDREVDIARKANRPQPYSGSGYVWKPFHERYPGSWGYYTLSRVGFSGRFAMVQIEGAAMYARFSCTHVLEKVGRRWATYTSGCGYAVAQTKTSGDTVSGEE